MVIEAEKNEGLILLAEFEIVSSPGNERTAMLRVGELAAEFDFSHDRLERLKTAVAEATMNAMEHGNKYQSELNALIRVYKTDDSLLIRIRDHGGGRIIPEHVIPDLDAKLDGLQSPRGWGLFLIENMVDEIHVHSDDRHHTIELRMKFRE